MASPIGVVRRDRTVRTKASSLPWACGGCGSTVVWRLNAVGDTSSEEKIYCDTEDCLAGMSPPSVALPESATAGSLPTASTARKNIPLARGVLDYFPAAIAAVAELSQAGNEKHNPGEELHWARGKSTDHADCIMRHLVDRGTVDLEDGISHSVKVAWRALALLQEELEQQKGAPLPRGARSAA